MAWAPEICEGCGLTPEYCDCEIEGYWGDGQQEDESDDSSTRSFVLPRLTQHATLIRLTLMSGNDFGGSGDSGGTFFG